MMDEALIDEVAQHGVIYNRQKYYLNGTGSGGGGGGGGGNGAPKYETKDEAWQIIAMKMHSDVETCKKRWKYLRERYVSQRKQGDPPVYEHLSRPYLEKMKFLDQHIQPRKSYRNVPNFLTSPHSANSSGYSEYNMDSKSNGSMKGMNHFASQHHYHQHQQPQDQHAMNALSSAAAAASALENAGVGNGHVKLEADQVFRDFAAAVASQQLQHISQSQQLHHHHQQQQHQQHQQTAVAVAAGIADSSHGYQDHFRDNKSNATGLTDNGCNHPSSNTITGLPLTSSPMKSPLSSPLASNVNEHTVQNGTVQQSTSLNHGPLTNQNYNDANNDDLDSSVSSNFNMKKPRVQLNNTSSSINNNTSNISQQNTNNNNHSSAANSQFTDDTDDDSDENSVNMLTPAQTMTTELHETSYNSTSVASTSTAAAAAVAAMQRHSTISNHSQHQHHHQQQSQQQQQQSMFPPNADFLFQLYQQLPHNQAAAAAAVTQQQHFSKFTTPQTPIATPTTQTIQQQPTQRSSEHLLGELVTTELLKMSKERRKTVQRRILEILFFDD